MSSWVKLSRKLGASAIAAKPDYLAVWVHMLISASYKEVEILVGRQLVRLKPGQFVFGRHKFAEKTGVSENIIRSALKVLESLQQITIKSESKFSVITITNWEKYQADEPANNQQRTSNAPATHHNKEIQEIQEEELSACALVSEDADGDGDIKPLRIPYEEIRKTFSKHCPSLAQPKSSSNWTEARKRRIRSLWTKGKKYGSVDFFDRFFEYVSKSDFLTGRKSDWRADFDWLLKPENFQKIVEGKYENEDRGNA